MIGKANRDITFTKGTLLGMIGAVLIVLYFVPQVLLAVGIVILVGGFALIGVSVFRLRKRLRIASVPWS